MINKKIMTKKNKIEELVDDYIEHLLMNQNLYGEIRQIDMLREQYSNFAQDVLMLVAKGQSPLNRTRKQILKDIGMEFD